MCKRDVIAGYDAPGFSKSRHGPFHVPFMSVNTTGIDVWHLTFAELDVKDIGGASPFPAG